MHRFARLKTGPAATLVCAGVEMLLIDAVKIPGAVSLGVIALVLAVSAAAILRATGPVRPAGASS